MPAGAAAPAAVRGRRRSPAVAAAGGLGTGSGSAGSRPPPLRPTRAQRRALRLARAGRLLAAVRALMGSDPAPRTLQVWLRALGLFLRRGTGRCSTSSVEEYFHDELDKVEQWSAMEAEEGEDGVPAEAVEADIRSAPRGSAPGPSGLRVEHLWALDAGGQANLLRLVQWLAGPDAAAALPPVVASELAEAELLLLRQPGDPLTPPACRPSGRLGCRRGCASWWRGPSHATCGRARRGSSASSRWASG